MNGAKRIRLCCTYKKGDSKNLNNYRGFALANSMLKIFTAITAKRVNIWCESYDILPEGQAGFRVNRGCEDNIFTLQYKISETLQKQKGRIFLTFIDFIKAFDAIHHNLLWRKLYKVGMSTQIIRVLKDIYDKASTQVKIDMTALTNIVAITK